MNLKQARKEFIQLWGNFGSQWGIKKTMAQVHALLLTSKKALTTDDVMGALSISRGGANMNLRELIVWGLVYKHSVSGDRKEYFVAEKDMWEVAKRISNERKRRELEPLRRHLTNLKNVDGNEDGATEFTQMIDDIDGLIGKVDGFSSLLMRAEQNAFFSALMKMVK